MGGNPQFQTSLTMGEEDKKMRDILDNRGITVIDTWRRGAMELIREIQALEEQTERD